ncbi:MAG: hypothetical protein M3O55_02755 [Actinomycetota bacterium]|nr:hypothetical protein [Actinomycetota bacterium]
MLAAQDYGPLKDVVAAAGAIIAAGTAIRLSWKGRAHWEPSGQDTPAGAQKVGGLVAGVLIALMWVSWRDAAHIDTLNRTVILLLGATLVCFLLYGFLVGGQTYELVKNEGPPEKVIGGFWLTRVAKKSKAEHNVTTQELLEGAAYDPEKLWSRPSRQLAKAGFQLGYLGLTICGTLALAAAAIRLGLQVG